jgi:pimeloyl-ACP methyl ester carboxylesterase
VRPDVTPIKGTVLLVPGASTMLKLGPNGQTDSTNFVIRTRSFLLANGFAIAYMDNPSDLREPIQRLAAIGKPVVVLSTSRGTIVAAVNAARLGIDGPDLLILTSPVTTGGDSLAGVDLHSITVPTLVVTNDNDTCRVSPPGGAVALTEHLSSATILHFSSSQITGNVCEPLSPHGYSGIEVDVMRQIVNWIESAH